MTDMLRLIRKELVEKRIWAILTLISSVLVLLIGTGYTFVGNLGAFSIWVILPMLASLYLGMMTFNTELNSAADFLYTKPISWWKILAAKLVAGLAVIIISAVLSAGIYAVIRPDQYTQFTTPVSLLTGIGWAVLLTGLSYLLGVSVSVLLPGNFGGIIAIAAIVVYGTPYSIFWNWVSGDYITIGYFVFALPIGVLAALIFTARFGITLPLSTRVFRYTVVVFGMLTTAVVVNAFIPSLSFNPIEYSTKTISISPDANCAFLRERFFVPGNASNDYSKSHLLRLSDGKAAAVDNTMRMAYWTPSGKVILGDKKGLIIAEMTADGKINKRLLPLPYPTAYSILQSPDRKLALVPTRENVLYIVDVENIRRLDVSVKDFKEYWWQSNSEFGYIDQADKRHIIKIE